jgi:hypothetical protein
MEAAISFIIRDLDLMHVRDSVVVETLPGALPQWMVRVWTKKRGGEMGGCVVIFGEL